MPNPSEEGDVFAECASLAELIVAVNKLLGFEAVDKLLAQADMPREALRQAASEIGRVGLRDLAKLIRQHARKAKPAPMNFKKRWAKQISQIRH
jgi:hypothetical protein